MASDKELEKENEELRSDIRKCKDRIQELEKQLGQISHVDLPTLFDEVQVLPGSDLTIDGKVYYSSGDKGRVCETSTKTTADGIDRFEIAWYRTGLVSTMQTTMWLQHFRFCGPGRTPIFGDEVECLPGVNFTHNGIEYYREGDRGRVCQNPTHTQGDGVNRFEVAWYRTGKVSTMKTEMWARNFKFVMMEDPIRELENNLGQISHVDVPTLFDEVQALPEVTFALHGQVYYSPGDKGRVAKSSAKTTDGIDRFEIAWYRTGLVSTMQTTMWLKNFRFCGPGRTPILGDEVECLPGVSFTHNGIEYYREGDRGRVCQNSTVTQADGVNRFEVAWYRTGKVSTMNTEMWVKNFKFVMIEDPIQELEKQFAQISHVDVPKLFDEVQALPGIGLTIDGKVYYTPGDKGRVCKASTKTATDGIDRFEIAWYRTGLVSTMQTTMWLKHFRFCGPGRTPVLGDEVECLPGRSFTQDGVEIYRGGDRGRVCQNSTVQGNGVNCFFVAWHRTGIVSSMVTELWVTNFKFVMVE